MNGSMGTSQTVRVVPDNGNGAASKQILDDLDRISKKVADYGQKMAQGLSRVTQHVKAENDKRIADDRRTTDKQLAEQQRLDAAREQIMHREQKCADALQQQFKSGKGRRADGSMEVGGQVARVGSGFRTKRQARPGRRRASRSRSQESHAKEFPGDRE